MAAIDPTITAAFDAAVVAALGLVSVVLLKLAASVTTAHIDLAGMLKLLLSAPTTPVAGGGAAVGIPSYDQLHDPLPDGSLPAGRFNECGEECCADIIRWVHGVEVSADALRSLLWGPRGHEITDAVDLAAILAHANVASEVGTQDAVAVKKYLLDVVPRSHPVIVLGNWVSPGVPHWVVVYNCSANGVTVNDPWGGRRYNLSWEAFARLYLNSNVTVQRLPDPP